jgi:L-asparaginase II
MCVDVVYFFVVYGKLMAPGQDLEMEAAKLLERLIHESRDEPAKLAAKLYMVCLTLCFMYAKICKLN